MRQEQMLFFIQSNMRNVADVTVDHINNIRWGVPGQRVAVKDKFEWSELDNHKEPVIARIVDAADEGLAISCTNIKGQNKPFHGPEINFFSLPGHFVCDVDYCVWTQ